MFKQSYQGGSRGVEILSASGSEPGKKFKMTGSATKEYDKTVKGFVYAMDKPSNTTNMQCPKSQRESLGVTQRLLCFQIVCPIGDLTSGYSIELVCLDSSKQRRRLLFGSAIKKVTSNSLHTQIPLTYDMCSWTTLVIDLPSVVSMAFPGCAYASLEFINIHPTCRVRKIFSLPNLNPYPHCIPGEFDFPDHLAGVAGSLNSHTSSNNNNNNSNVNVNTCNSGKSNVQIIDERFIAGVQARQAALETDRRTKAVSSRQPFKALAMPASSRGPSRAFVSGVGTASGASLQGMKAVKPTTVDDSCRPESLHTGRGKATAANKSNSKSGMGGTFNKARLGIRAAPSTEPPEPEPQQTRAEIEHSNGHGSSSPSGSSSPVHSSSHSMSARKKALQHVSSRYLEYRAHQPQSPRSKLMNDSTESSAALSSPIDPSGFGSDPDVPPPPPATTTAASVFRISTDSIYTHDYPASNAHGPYSVTATAAVTQSLANENGNASPSNRSTSRRGGGGGGGDGGSVPSVNSSINSNVSGISNFWSAASIGSVSRRHAEPIDGGGVASGSSAASMVDDSSVSPAVPLSLLLGIPSAISAPLSARSKRSQQGGTVSTSTPGAGAGAASVSAVSASIHSSGSGFSPRAQFCGGNNNNGNSSSTSTVRHSRSSRHDQQGNDSSNSTESGFGVGSPRRSSNSNSRRGHTVQEYRSDILTGHISHSGKLNTVASAPAPVVLSEFLHPSVRDREELYISVLSAHRSLPPASGTASPRHGPLRSSSSSSGSGSPRRSPQRASSHAALELGLESASASTLKPEPSMEPNSESEYESQWRNSDKDAGRGNSSNKGTGSIGYSAFADARRVSCENHLEAALRQYRQEYGSGDDDAAVEQDGEGDGVQSLASLNESIEDDLYQ